MKKTSLHSRLTMVIINDQMVELTHISLVVGQVFWSTTPGQFSESMSSRSWQYFSATCGTLVFPLPKMQEKPIMLRIVLSPSPHNLKFTQVSHQPTSESRLHHWNPDATLVRPVNKPEGSALFSADALGELRAIESAEGAWHIDLPPDFSQRLKKGGFIHFEFAFSLGTLSQIPIAAPVEITTTKREYTLSRLGVLSRRLIEAQEESTILRREVQKFYACNSWKITTPLRSIASKMRLLGLFKKRPNNSLTKPACRRGGHSNRYTRVVDIIVPVYLGLNELKSCIESLNSSSCKVDYELIFINDFSPDPEITSYLRNLKSKNRSITLLENERNLGFTETVNRGMDCHPDRDVVLLNSDTKVSLNWLDRLINHAYAASRVATVTPLSNNASICGYPRFLGAEELPNGWTPEDIDKTAQAINSGLNVQVPTGVGFCMLIRRDCLDEVGIFDAATFPGYGEENDFCVRASRKNWIHLLAGDTFVYHKGAASFKETSESKKLKALATLRRLYPSYDPDIQRFIAIDPPKTIRHRIDRKRLFSSSKPTILAIMHNGTGGTERHIKELIELFDDRITWLLLKADAHGALLNWVNKGEGFSMYFEWHTESGAMLEFLKSCSISRAHIHHTYGFTSQCQQLIAKLNTKFDFTIHDFATACPRVQFVDYTGAYCGQPDETGCNQCLTYLPTPGAPDIQTWRTSHKWLFSNAERIFAPSSDAAKRIKSYFSEREIICTPHLDQNDRDLLAIPVTAPATSVAEKLRVAVLGALNEGKGADILESCAIDAIERQLPIEFHLLGHAYRELLQRPQSALLIYGQYKDIDLQELLAQVNPHFVWFPAVWPETYCYTLSACMEAGLPIVAPRLGAFEERLSGRKLTWLQPWNQNPQAWNDFFNSEVRRTIFQDQNDTSRPLVQQKIHSSFNYDSDYLSWTEDLEAKKLIHS